MTDTEKKPLDIETLRIEIGRALYDDTFKAPGGPAWLSVPPDVRDGFIRMVGVMFNKLFEKDPVQLAEFFVDEGLNKQEFDAVVLKARQTGMTFRMMQQRNAFVQRSALFTLAEAMLQDLDNLSEEKDSIASSGSCKEQFDEYRAAIQQIKEAADPAAMRAAAILVSPGEAANWNPDDEQAGQAPSSILGTDGKPLVPGT